MPNTTRGYPYPSSGDDVDVPGDLQALATAIDTDVAAVAGSATTAIASAVANIEGTVIKSTGVTAGYVLTAGAGGTTTVWNAQAAAQWTSGTLTVSLINPANINANTNYYSGTSGSATFWSVGGGGTQLAAISPTATTTANQNFRVFNLDFSTSSGSVAANSTASMTRVNVAYTTATISDFIGTGFQAAASGGTSWVVYETESGAGTSQAYLRKLTSTATNPWNTTMRNVADTRTHSKLKYAPEIDAFYGYEGNSANASTARMFIVNNQTGTKYDATWHVHPAAANDAVAVTSFVFVPSVAGGAAGTIYAAGYGSVNASGTNFTRVVAYTVGTASITAASTVTATAAFNFPAITSAYTADQISPLQMIWDSGATAIVVGNTSNMQGINGEYMLVDRALGTVISRIWTQDSTLRANTPSTLGMTEDGRYDSSCIDPVNRWVLQGSNADRLIMGGRGNMYFGNKHGELITTIDARGLAGTAAATHFISATLGTALISHVTAAYERIGTAVIASETSPRLISIADGYISGAFSGYSIKAVHAAGARLFGAVHGGGTVASSAATERKQKWNNFLLPANAGATVYVGLRGDVIAHGTVYYDIETIRLG